MSTIGFICPKCKTQLQGDLSTAGQKVTCPKCSQIMIVPSGTAPQKSNSWWKRLFGKKASETSRRPAPQGGTCDLCNVQIGSAGLMFSANEMRKAARSGLRPSQVAIGERPGVTGADIAALFGMAPGDADGAWLATVQNDQTDWAICARCRPVVEKHLA